MLAKKGSRIKINDLVFIIINYAYKLGYTYVAVSEIDMSTRLIKKEEVEFVEGICSTR